jgi:hypothetical protein
MAGVEVAQVNVLDRVADPGQPSSSVAIYFMSGPLPLHELDHVGVTA